MFTLQNGIAKNCATSPVAEHLESKKPLCHVTSDNSGRFVFPSLSPGEYKLVPHYAGLQTKFDVQPPVLSFKVSHNSVTLQQDFKVTGFTVGGLVLSSTNGSPLSEAKIFLSQKEVALTDRNGRYVLDNMKTGQYTLRAESGMQMSIFFIEQCTTSFKITAPANYLHYSKCTIQREGCKNISQLT